jgi:acyl carrier protein
MPSALVPSQYVLLAQFPLTPNGKIDRQALRRLTPTEVRNECYVAPRTMLEELLVEVWQEVLKVERLGIHDNFFELGGHSLLATRVIARLRNVLDLDIPLRSLFEHPTVEQLASVIDTQLSTSFPDWPTDESPTSGAPSIT